MASIIVISGESEGDYYPLGQRTTVFGRAESVPAQILDERVSRRHLQIRYEPANGRYYAPAPTRSVLVGATATYSF